MAGHAERIMINSSRSVWWLITSRVLQGLIQQAMLYKSPSTDDGDDDTEYTLSNFAGDTNLGRVAGTLSGTASTSGGP